MKRMYERAWSVMRVALEVIGLVTLIDTAYLFYRDYRETHRKVRMS